MEIREYGAPEMLVKAERPDPAVPAAGSGEVLIHVKAAGINRPDVLQRKGHYPVPPGASDIPGLEVAGEIIGGDLARENVSEHGESVEKTLVVNRGRKVFNENVTNARFAKRRIAL